MYEVSRDNSTNVLIVGAGPVGLVLGIDLAQRGISVTIVEARRFGELPPVKSNHVSARSMEMFRRLGFVEAVRNAGLPEEYPNDVSYRLSFTGKELSRISIPARKFRYIARTGPDTGWPTAEPPHRINQIYLEPILYEQAKMTLGLTILDGVRIDDLVQDGDVVSATGTRLDDGSVISFRADFLVGCDGGRSIVRKKIGATFTGDAEIGRVQSTYIKAPDLLGRSVAAPAWATFSYNPQRCGNVYAIDGKENWLVHNYLGAHEQDFDSVDRDACIRDILGVGSDFQYETLSCEDWIARRLVADKFRNRRVFICGDACHLWVPMAGYGMNAGIADAMALSWMLAAFLQGWGGEKILDAYEAERQPITEQVSHYAMSHARSLERERGRVPANIEEEGEDADAARNRAGKALYDLNVKQYCCAGLNFGYFYDRSPIISYDGTAHPGYTMDQFTSSTVPGCRLPHFDVPNAGPLYDSLGCWFTLLVFDSRVDITDICDAATQCGMPIHVVQIEGGYDPEIFEHKLLIARPDMHVAWRGDAVPTNPQELLDKLRGEL